MKPQQRLLFWEQTRTAGVLCLAVGLIMLGIFLHLLRLHARELFFFSDVQEIAESVYLVMLFFAGAVILVRQNSQGHLSLDFEPRLAQLPVNTSTMVWTVFGARLFYIGALALTTGILYTLLFEQAPAPQSWAAALSFSAWAQTLAWSRKSITGMVYFAPSCVLALILMLWLFGVEPASMAHLAGQWLPRLAHPLATAVLVPTALLTAHVSVVLLRRDEHIGPPPVGDLFAWASDFQAARARAFASPLEAQLWFEQRRVGRLLPLLTLLFTCLLIALSTAMPDLLFDARTRFIFAPFAGLIGAAFIVGPITLRPRSRMPFHRPQTATQLAMAAALINARGLLLCFPLVALLAAVGLLWGGYDGVAVTRMLAVGDLAPLEAAVLLLRPVLAMVLIAWMVLWLTTLPYLVPTLIVFAWAVWEAVYFDYQKHAHLLDLVNEVGVMFPIILMIAAISIASALLALKRRLIVSRQLVVGLLFWQNIAFLLIAAAPWVHWHYYGAVTGLTLSTLLLLPLLAAPLSLFRRKCNG